MDDDDWMYNMVNYSPRVRIKDYIRQVISSIYSTWT